MMYEVVSCAVYFTLNSIFYFSPSISQVRLHFVHGFRFAEMPVKFQSDAIIITSNLVASRLHELWR